MGLSREEGSTATCIPLTEDRSSPLVGKVVLFDRACSFWRDAHGSVREEGDTCLASQISRINPGDQWGDRCHSQIALTSDLLLFLIVHIRNSVHSAFESRVGMLPLLTAPTFTSLTIFTYLLGLLQFSLPLTFRPVTN